MNGSEWIRQSHRWASIAFTAALLLTIVVMTRGEPPIWVSLLPLPPLALLLLTGLYLFVLPYAVRRRGGRGAGSSPTVETP